MFNFPQHIYEDLFFPGRSFRVCECVCTCYKDDYHVNKLFNLKSFSVFELLLNNVFYPDVTQLH